MSVWEFAAVALPFVVSPGASFMLTVEAAAAGDRRAALRVWIGTAVGISAIAVVAGFSGLAEVVARDSAVRATLRLVGGVVLIAFAVRALLSLRSAASPTQQGLAAAPETRRRPARLVLWAFLAVITNIKALSLYLLVVPSLAAPSLTAASVYVVFTATHLALLFAWLGILASFVCAVPAVARRPRVQVGLRVFAAATLFALGVGSIGAAFA